MSHPGPGEERLGDYRAAQCDSGLDANGVQDRRKRIEYDVPAGKLVPRESLGSGKEDVVPTKCFQQG